MRKLIQILKDIWGFFRGNGGLKITVISGSRALMNCGSAEWQVQWSLKNMGKTGWVIQHVTWAANVTDCAGSDKQPHNSNGLEYWEAWEVKNGKVWVGSASRGIQHHADTYRTVDEGDGTKGKVIVTGRVRFYSNYNLAEPPWGHTVHAAGILPTVTSQPTCWTDSGANQHDMEVTWRCCPSGRFTTRMNTMLARTDFWGIIRRIFGFAVFLTKTGKGMDNSTEGLSKEVIGLIRLISEMPSWCDLPVDDTTDRKQILNTMQKIGEAPTQSVRQAMSAYVEEVKHTEEGYDVSAMSRLYLLNRFLFNVPFWAEPDRPGFGSFFGIPTEGNAVNELWPLSIGVDKQLILDGEFAGYFGESYLGVQEFDYFNENYGRREVQG